LNTKRIVLVLPVLLWAVAAAPSLATAATLTTIATFNTLNGASPYANVIADASGNLYGTTNGGGTNGQGTVFRLDASNNYALTTLVNFNVSTSGNGAQPYAGLISDAAGNLYGTTFGGGTSGVGTVFKLDASNNFALTTLVNFASTTSSPNEPRGNFGVDAAGNFYSTTVNGGRTHRSIVRHNLQAYRSQRI